MQLVIYLLSVVSLFWQVFVCFNVLLSGTCSRGLMDKFLIDHISWLPFLVYWMWHMYCCVNCWISYLLTSIHKHFSFLSLHAISACIPLILSKLCCQQVAGSLLQLLLLLVGIQLLMDLLACACQGNVDMSFISCCVTYTNCSLAGLAFD